MREEQAVVVETGPDYVWVERLPQPACGPCTAYSNCGMAALAETRGTQYRRLRVLTEQPLPPGTVVVIGLAERVLVQGAVLAYLIPVVGLLTGALLGKWNLVGAGEGLAILGGALGFGLGLWTTRILTHNMQNDPRVQPVVIQVLGKHSGQS